MSEVKSQVTQSLLAVGSSAASTTLKMSSSLTQAAVSVAAMERYNQDREEEEAKFVRLADFRRAEKEKQLAILHSKKAAKRENLTNAFFAKL